MLSAAIEGAQMVIGKSQGFKGLALRQDKTDDGDVMLTSAWEPTPAEIEALLAGAKIHVSILGCAHPPISLSVGPVPKVGP